MRHKETFILTLLISVLLTICIVKYFFLEPSFLNVSAAETAGQVGVYWDKSCSQKAYSISWGVLTPGAIKRVVVYVRNEGNETCLLILTPENWNPNNASNYLNFSWDCEDNRIEVGEVVKVTQSLLVSPNIVGVTDFSFDIIFEGRQYFLGDINRDGVVDLKDCYIVCLAYGSTPNDSNWNPDADLNKDGAVDLKDIVIVAKEYGKK